jgi:hypothetical protein
VQNWRPIGCQHETVALAPDKKGSGAPTPGGSENLAQKKSKMSGETNPSPWCSSQTPGLPNDFKISQPSNGTFQMSWAYSPIVRSEENQAIRAMLKMLARIQSNVDSHSLSTLL